MQQVEAWQPQIDAVVAGKVDATMVPETVWEKVAENKKTTKIIATQENLPSPLILCKKDANKELVKELKELLFAFQDPHAPLFNGFIPYQKELTEAFFSEAELAYSGR
jgi:phosphonate transport system substrate-binding protein